MKQSTKPRKVGGAAIHKRRSFLDPGIPNYTPDQSRVCVLTGASGLLGDEFIKRYSLDYKIIAIVHEHAIKPPAKMVDPLYSGFGWENPAPIEIRCDLSNPNEIDELAKTIIEQHKNVDLLINAACVRHFGNLLADGALDRADEAFLVNVTAPMRLSVALMKNFWLQQGVDENIKHRRNIVNLSSTASSYVYPDAGQGLYSASKAALNYATYHMASEFWEHGIRVNAIAPNTFPGIVPTYKVLDQIIAFDKGDDTGRVLLIDRE